MNSITNDADIIDSRDVIERIEELEAIGELDENEQDELSSLKSLAADASGYAPDWEYGETLIRDSAFEDYTRDLVVDCGYIPADLPSWIEIDWEKTADNVRQDYTNVEFDGVTYWIR